MGRIDHMVIGLEFVLLVGIGRDFLGRNRGLLGGRGMRFGCGHFCFRWALSRKSARGMIISRQYGRNAPRRRRRVWSRAGQIGKYPITYSGKMEGKSLQTVEKP